jgi:2-iminobutanoate/2-iminopropanoate deaminase
MEGWMQRTVISVESDPSSPAGLPLSPAIVAGPFVFVSGQVAVDPHTNRFTGGDTATQTHQVIKNLQGLLERAGSSLADVVKTTVFLTNIDDFPAFNDVYRSYFPSEPPARTTVQAARLLGSFRVEIDAVALLGDADE